MIKTIIGVFIGVVLGGIVLIAGYEQYANYRVKSALEAVEKHELEKSQKEEQQKIQYQEYLTNTYAKRCQINIEKRYKDVSSVDVIHKTEKLVAISFMSKQKPHHARCYISDQGTVREFELVQ